MARRDEKAWYDAFGEGFGLLSPQEQEDLLAGVGYQPMSFTSEPSYSEEFADPLTDYPLQGVTQIPEYTSKGALDPFDLSQQAKRVNLAQDYGALLLDNILSGLAGPGAYDIGQFTPQVEYGNEMRMPGQERLQKTAQAGGWEGYLASKMLEGASPSGAMAALEEFVSTTDPNDPDLDDETRNALKTLHLPRSRSGEPTPPNPRGASNLPEDFWAPYDEERVWDAAQNLYNATFEDELPGHVETDAEGNVHYYDRPPEVIKTPQMEFFDKYGLPYPTAQYSDPEYLEAFEQGTRGAPEQRAAEDLAWQREYGGATLAAERAAQNVERTLANNREMAAAWEKMTPEVTRAAPGFVTPEAPNPFPTYGPGVGVERQGPNLAARGFGRGPAQLSPEAQTSEWSSPVPVGGHTPTTWGLASTFDPNRTVTTPASEAPFINVSPGRMGLAEPPEQRGMLERLLGPTRDLGTEPRGFFDQAFGPARRSFSAFANDEPAPGTTTRRRMTASDVSPKASRERGKKARSERTKAQRRQQEASYADPRLAGGMQYAYYQALANQGRTPLQDAIAQRRLGARALGL